MWATHPAPHYVEGGPLSIGADRTHHEHVPPLTFPMGGYYVQRGDSNLLSPHYQGGKTGANSLTFGYAQIQLEITFSSLGFAKLDNSFTARTIPARVRRTVQVEKVATVAGNCSSKITLVCFMS